MHLAQEALLEFHKKMKQTIGDPRKPDIKQEQEFRLELIREEMKELIGALEANDTVETADALADLIYVLVGAAVTWGIDLASVFDEVHRSNMAKKPGNKREDGKILKDKDFSPPDIQGVLDEVAENYDDGPDGWWEKPYCAQPRPALEEPPQHVTDNVMVAAKDQAKILAMKSIKADFLPGIKSNGVTESGVPYTVNENAWKAYVDEAWTQEGKSDGIPQAITGHMTSYGAYIFDCHCGRRQAVQAKLGSRGGMANTGQCECICGKAYVVELQKDPPLVWETTIEELRKDSGK